MSDKPPYTDESVEKMKSLQYWQEEVEKCKNPYYFWKNYVFYEGKKDLTEDEFNDLFTKRIALKNRRGYYSMYYPQITSDCFPPINTKK